MVGFFIDKRLAMILLYERERERDFQKEENKVGYPLLL